MPGRLFAAAESENGDTEHDHAHGRDDAYLEQSGHVPAVPAHAGIELGSYHRRNVQVIEDEAAQGVDGVGEGVDPVIRFGSSSTTEAPVVSAS